MGYTRGSLSQSIDTDGRALYLKSGLFPHCELRCGRGDAAIASLQMDVRIVRGALHDTVLNALCIFNA